jgi:hypothetical protein
VIESRGLRLGRACSTWRKKRYMYTILNGNLKRRDQLERRGVGEKILVIITFILRTLNIRYAAQVMIQGRVLVDLVMKFRVL